MKKIITIRIIRTPVTGISATVFRAISSTRISGIFSAGFVIILLTAMVSFRPPVRSSVNRASFRPAANRLAAVSGPRDTTRLDHRSRVFPVSRRQKEKYEEALKPVYHKDNMFYPQALLDFQDSAIQAGNRLGGMAIMTQYIRLNKGLTLLKLGREQDAVDVLEALVSSLTADAPDQLVLNSWSDLGLAYLRLGERTNCIMDHCMGSCVFPIRGSGIYTHTDPSRKAIEIYKALLQQRPDDLESRWLLNVAYMTLGEYPQNVALKWLIPGLDEDDTAYAIKPFVDMAGGLGLGVSRNMAGGSIVDDFDDDGYMDIITSNWGLQESMHYYRNNRDGSFTDLSKESGLSDIRGGLNLIQADYNNDGHTDILVLRGAWMGEFGKQPSTLLRNNGDGTFTDVTLESGLFSCEPTQTAVWADFNNDGWLDLFIGHETSSDDHPHPSQLFLNNHDGSFTEAAKKAGCQALAFMKGIAAADYNKDGWTDLFISTQDGHGILLKNKGAGPGGIPGFEETTLVSGLDQLNCPTFPTWFFDYDNDSWPDLFVSGYPHGKSLAMLTAAEALHQLPEDAAPMHLYHNNHDGTFTDVSKETGLDRPVYAMGANFEDIDNDGWLDMYLATGDPNYRSLIPNRLFKNLGGKAFTDVTRSARVGNLQKGHGVAFSDVNNDGDMDFFVETGGAYPGDAYYNSFYVNPGQNDNNWITLRLEGIQSNRSAIGAHLELIFTENGVKRSVFRDINSGGSFGASSLRKTIGIGKATVIDSLVIHWPASGRRQIFTQLKPRQFLHIREDSDKAETIDLKAFQFKPQMGPMPGMRSTKSSAPGMSQMPEMGSMPGMSSTSGMSQAPATR